LLIATAVSPALALESIDDLWPVDARSLGMGAARIASTGDPTSVWFNPAGLAWLQAATEGGKAGTLSAGYAYADIGEGYDAFHAYLAAPVGRPATAGWGAGFGTVPDVGSMYGAGFGARLGRAQGWSWGAALVRDTNDDAFNLVNLGVILGGVPVGQQQPGGSTLRLGATMVDLFEEAADTTINVGVALQGEGFIVELDVVDLTEEVSQQVNVGGELGLGKNSAGRIGSQDGDLTWGIGWRLGALTLDLVYANFLEGEIPTYGFTVSSGF